MHHDCNLCESKRNCINGAYCQKLKKYIEFTKNKECDESKRI